MDDYHFVQLSKFIYALALYSQIATKKAPQRQTSAARVYPAQAQSQSHKNHYRRATNTAATAISAMPITSIFDDDDFNYHHQYLHNELSRTTDPAYAYEIDNIWHGTSFDSTHHSIEDSFSHDSMNDFMHNSTDSFSHDSMNSFSHDSMNGF